MSQIGKNIEVYLMDGDASGRWEAKLLNWNCVAYKIPRNSLKNSDDIPEIYAPGVYFLFGRDDETGKQFVYVGEGDNVIKRIQQVHSFEKEDTYWTEAVIYVTPDGTLDKARIKFLENRFYTIATETDRYIVKNGNTPPQSPVQKKVKDMLEEFIINARLVMLVLGHKVFEPQPSADSGMVEEELLYFVRNQGKGGKATGRISDDGFWVLKGSYIYPKEASYLPSGVIKMRKLHARDVDKNGILQKDICFGSPSYASSFVCGRNSNGLVDWKNNKGVSIKELNGEGDACVPKNEKKLKKQKKSTGKNMQHGVEVEDKDTLHLASKKMVAYAYVLPEGILVKKGSRFSDTESKSCEKSIRVHRKRLIDEKRVIDNVFVEDVLFKSPSTAAACILGRNTNGRTAWVDKEGKTLKEIQEKKDN